MSALKTVNLVGGKYTIHLHEDTGAMRFLRNGEAWPGGQEAFQHAGVVMALVQRVVELEESNSGLVEALKGMVEAWNMVCDTQGWERDHIQAQVNAVAALACAGAT